MAKLKLDPKRQRNKYILEERKTGKSITEIAKIFEISRQRVYQILTAHGDPLPREMMQK